MRSSLAVAAVTLVVIAACGGGDDGPPSDAPTGPEAIELVMDPDGRERGSGMTSAEGVVAFYSPAHQALFSLDLESTGAAVADGVEIHVEASQTGVSYYATDPSGRYMPLMFESPIPTALDQTLEVNGADSLLAPDASSSRVVFARVGGKPFIVGLLVSINIRAVLVGIGEAAVLMVLTDLVTDTCKFFAPLHEDTCGTIGAVVDAVATVATGGVKLALGKGFSWLRAAGQATWELAKNKLVETACGAAGKVLVGWLKPPPDGEKAVQTRYRQAAYAYRLLMDKLDTMPPADPAARAELKADLVAAGKAIALIAPKVRNHYYEVYNTEGPDDFLTKATFKATAETVKNLVEIRPLVFESLTLASGYEELLLITNTSVYYERYEFSYGRLETSVGEPLETPWAAKFGFDCAMAAAEAATIQWTQNGVAQTAEIEIETALGHMVDMVDMFLDDVHAEFYGGDVPPPACLPDIWEANDTWQSALAAPFAGMLGSGIVRVEDVNLCDGTDASDEDWFTMDAAPINFGVEARIRAPMTGGMGQNERVCLEMYWYSQISELSMTPPYLLPGSACGTVASEFSTDQVNVAQSTGESYRYVMVRVFPDPQLPPPAGPIDYTITFTH